MTFTNPCHKTLLKGLRWSAFGQSQCQIGVSFNLMLAYWNKYISKIMFKPCSLPDTIIARFCPFISECWNLFHHSDDCDTKIRISLSWMK